MSSSGSLGGTRRRGRGRGSTLARSSSDGGGGGDRSLRHKSDRKQYVDGVDSDDEDDGFRQTFDVVEKLLSPKFLSLFVKEIRGDEVTLDYFQRFVHVFFRMTVHRRVVGVHDAQGLAK